MNQNIFIGQSMFHFQIPISINWDETSNLFLYPTNDSNTIISHYFNFIPVINLPSVGCPITSKIPTRNIYMESNLEAREFIDESNGSVYGISVEIDHSHTDIYLDAKLPYLFSGNRFFFNYLSLEHHLIHDKQIILHSCFIIHNGEAILFSAPSQTGKSTQGNHWKTHYNSNIINGDRSLLGLKNGCWKAYGIPFSGTSGICKNESAPIKAIVYLNQSKENTTVKLSPAEAFIKLYSQITINNWNASFISEACNLLENLVTSVPVYDFFCTKYPESAEYLHSVLYK